MKTYWLQVANAAAEAAAPAFALLVAIATVIPRIGDCKLNCVTAYRPIISMIKEKVNEQNRDTRRYRGVSA
ncbi:MAG: hypothetical protein OES26_14820, partial [Gammaproteobacteria bacterium]|nr:hypothetical protein [Gammaproteobacteria bacterium]